MTKRIFGVLFSVLLLAGCGKTDSPYRKEVKTYINELVNGTYQSRLGMKLFDPQAIPDLLAYADDQREIQYPPVNPLSSYIVSSCSVGMFVLWTVEGIRQEGIRDDDRRASFGYPSLVPLLWDEDRGQRPEYGEDGYDELQKRASAAYRNWWNSGSFGQIKSRDPLEGTGLHW